MATVSIRKKEEFRNTKEVKTFMKKAAKEKPYVRQTKRKIVIK